jgi:hypothetical protein
MFQMLKYENDYINLVVLGSFNPAILRHEFLVGECGFDLPIQPESKIPVMPMPVVSSIDYGSLTFFADLGRLEIKQKNCQDPDSSRLPEYLETYLTKLPHTPITKCGANFSYTVTVAQSKLEQIEQWLKENRGKFCELLRHDPIDLEVHFETGDKTEALKTWTVRTKRAEHDVSTMLKVTPGFPGKVKMDFNYEVGGLDKNRGRLMSVTAEYKGVFRIFKQQVDSIFAG